jgi:hypothetical protein
VQIWKVVEYEIYITKSGSMDPNLQTIWIAQAYFNTVFGMLALGLLLNRKCLCLLFEMNFLSVLLWFSNSYFRLIIFVGIVPNYERLMWVVQGIKRYNLKHYEKRFISNIFFLQAWTLYFMFYGSTISNVNIRAANRASGIQMGEWYIESGIIFVVCKFAIPTLVLGFLYLR